MLQEILETILKIDSPSGHEKRLSSWVSSFLKKQGLKPRTDRFANLFCLVPGSGRPLALTAHLDTIKSTRGLNYKIENQIIKTDGRTILGGDDKASVALILFLVKHLKENKTKHRPLEIIFTVSEEIGLVGSRGFNKKQIKSEQIMGFDKALPAGRITSVSRGVLVFDLKFKGRSAHSGYPERGRNALLAAVDFINRVNKISSKKAAVNFGKISGGEAVNIVPGAIKISGSIRFLDKKNLNFLLKKIEGISKNIFKKHGVKVVLKKEIVCNSFSVGKISDLPKIKNLLKKQKISPKMQVAGGASDLNVFALNIPECIEICFYQKDLALSHLFVGASGQ
jgi:tripeptide aminopeptidase